LDRRPYTHKVDRLGGFILTFCPFVSITTIPNHERDTLINCLLLSFFYV